VDNKQFGISISSGYLISLIDSFGIKMSGVSYNPNAQLLFDAVGDVPEVVKPFYSDLIQSFEDSGVWANANFWAILCVPSLNAFNSLIEIKSLTIQSSFYDTGAISAPYNNARQAIPTFAGYSFRSNGYIRTGFIPSAKQTLNNSSEFIVNYSTETGVATFNYGSFTGATVSTAFSIRLNTNALVGDAYSTTVGSGRVSVASTDGISGVYIKNRRSSTYMSIVKNGIVVGSNTSANGTLPAVETYLNTFNSSGVAQTRRNQSPISAWGSFGTGITSQQETDLSTALSTWQIAMERKENIATKQIVLDGNSHTVYWLAQMFTTIQYNTIVTGWKYTNTGVSGQTTAQMLSDYAAEIAPLYSASLTRNIYIPVEVTNDLFLGATIQQAKDNYEDLCLAAQATGYEVYSVPIMCRNYSGNTGRTQTQWNLVCDEFNQWLVANYATFSDGLVPINTQTFIWRSSYASDAAYNTAVASLIAASPFYDGTHLISDGYTTWGTQISNTIV